MSLTTKSIVGQLGYRELAGIGLAADTAAEIVIVLVGTLSVVGVLVAQAVRIVSTIVAIPRRNGPWLKRALAETGKGTGRPADPPLISSP